MMSNAAITAPYLRRATIDIQTADHALTEWAYCDSRNLDIRDNQLSLALQATVRALKEVAAAVERLAELPQCDGSHE